MTITLESHRSIPGPTLSASSSDTIFDGDDPVLGEDGREIPLTPQDMETRCVRRVWGKPESCVKIGSFRTLFPALPLSRTPEDVGETSRDDGSQPLEGPEIIPFVGGLNRSTRRSYPESKTNKSRRRSLGSFTDEIVTMGKDKRL